MNFELAGRPSGTDWFNFVFDADSLKIENLNMMYLGIRISHRSQKMGNIYCHTLKIMIEVEVRFISRNLVFTFNFFSIDRNSAYCKQLAGQELCSSFTIQKFTSHREITIWIISISRSYTGMIRSLTLSWLYYEI